MVALKLVPDRDGGGGANAEENDDANANDNSIADTDENKENINNSAAAAVDSSGSQNPVRVKADRPIRRLAVYFFSKLDKMLTSTISHLKVVTLTAKC